MFRKALGCPLKNLGNVSEWSGKGGVHLLGHASPDQPVRKLREALEQIGTGEAYLRRWRGLAFTCRLTSTVLGKARFLRSDEANERCVELNAVR